VTGTHRGDGSNLTGLPTSIIAGSGISVNASTGAVTITNNNPTPYANANVASYLLTNTGNIAAGNISATGTVTGTHAGNGAGLSNIVTSITAGSGISVNAATGAVTITATGGGGGGTSIANGNTNIRIDTAGGPILANVGGYANVANIFAPAANVVPYPLVNLRAGVNIFSQAGGPNPSFPFDGGMAMDGSLVASGNINCNGTGIFGTFRGTVLTSLGVQCGAITASGQINAQSSGFKANQRTVAQGVAGTAGEIFWDANYIYVCTATNTWKRAALTTY
jgi:hypothetical protein